MRQADDESWRIVAKDLRMMSWKMCAAGAVAIAILSGCAAKPAAPDSAAGKVTPQMRSGSPELRSYQINDWIAPDDRTLIVNAADRSLFQGRFRNQCTGLRLTETIAFVVPSPPQLDRYAAIVLPDGRRCAFESFARLEIPPAEAQATR
jgi:hypothetical protein